MEEQVKREKRLNHLSRKENNVLYESPLRQEAKDGQPKNGFQIKEYECNP
jgi:hypothetical protein